MFNHHLNYVAEPTPNSFLHNNEWVELKDPRSFFSEFPLDSIPILQQEKEDLEQEKEDLEHDYKVLQEENTKLEKTVSTLQKRIDDYVGKVQLQLDELIEKVES